MKNFKKNALITATLSLMVATSAHASSDETVRLIITNKAPQLQKMKTQHSQFTQQTGQVAVSQCIDTPDGMNSWCVGTPKSLGVSQYSASQQDVAKKLSIETVTLNSYGYEAKEVAKAMNESGLFGAVEVDQQVFTDDYEKVVVTSQSEDVDINDPGYGDMSYLKGSDVSPVGTSVAEAWSNYSLFDKKDSIDVIVLDSSFFINEDVDYKEGAGRSFSRIPLSSNGPLQARGDFFNPAQETLDAGMCSGHGLSVAGVIGAKQNNGIAGTGVLGNVDIHPIRVMSCGKGYMSDVVDSLLWLAGDDYSSDNISPYTGNPGVVNISLRASSDTCGIAMQEAINLVSDKGFTVVVASGNDSENTNTSSPANCDNVVSVTALTAQGDLTYFGNHNEMIDAAVIGENLIAPCDETSDYCFVSGTSFSSPLVAGMVAATKLKANPSKKVLDLALKFSSNPDVIKDACVIDGVSFCGAGVPNLQKMISISEKAANGTLNTIKYALDKNADCDDTWYVNNFSGSVPVCKLFEVTLFADNAPKNVTFKLFESEKGSNSEPTLIGEYTKSTVFIENVDAENKDYSVKYCESGVCNDDSFSVNTELATVDYKPESCKE